MSDKIILKSNLDGIADAYIEFTGSGIRIGSNGVGVWLAADQARHLYAELGDNGLGGWTYNSQPAEPVPPVALHTAEYDNILETIKVLRKDMATDFTATCNAITSQGEAAFTDIRSLQEQIEALRASVNGADSVVQRHVAALKNRVTALEQQPGPVNTIEPDDTFHRQHLYNQAYLAALPALVRVGQIPDDIAHMADLIATMCMEHLK